MLVNRALWIIVNKSLTDSTPPDVPAGAYGSERSLSMAQEKPEAAIRIEDGSLYATVRAAHDLWRHYSGNRDPDALIAEAIRAGAELEEMLTRNDSGFHQVVDASTPGIDDLVVIFRECATHMPDVGREPTEDDRRKGNQNARFWEVINDYHSAMRLGAGAVPSVNQTAFMRREAIARVAGNMSDIMLSGLTDEDSMECLGTAQINVQMFMRRVTRWGDPGKVNRELLEQMSVLFGQVYLLKLFAIFAVNESLREAQRVSLHMLVLCGSYKYGPHAEIVEAFGETLKLFVCQYCDFGPCGCANRPPVAGVAKMKQRQLKYPETDEDQMTVAQELTVDQLDWFMSVVYLVRNMSQAMTRSVDRTRWEWDSEFLTGVSIARAGSIGAVARAEGQFATVRRRRWGKAFMHSWPGGLKDPQRPTTDEQIQALLYTEDGPYDTRLNDPAIQQIFRHAAADPLMWGALPPINYGLRFWNTNVAAMRHFVRMHNRNPKRKVDLVLEIVHN